MATTELRVDNLVWLDTDGNEQTTPASTLPRGTRCVFNNDFAPVGWTKDGSHNNKALRIIGSSESAVSSGGNVSFTGAMTNRGVSGNVSVSVSSTALNWTGYMPSHRHYYVARSNKNHSSGSTSNAYSSNNYPARYQYSNYEGGNGSHSHGANASFSGHSIDMSIMYVDFIIAEKD